jgi:hypothetical protein
MTLFPAPWPEPGTEIRPSEEVSSTSWNSLGPLGFAIFQGLMIVVRSARSMQFRTHWHSAYSLKNLFNLGGCCYQKNETNNV